MTRIVLCGRPNVGKSTLFNRLCGRRQAIVHDQAGVTRDWKDVTIQYDNKHQVTYVDTPGLEEIASKHSADLTQRMSQKALQILKDADLILFVVDAKTGLLPLDSTFFAILRKIVVRGNVPIHVIANKCENEDRLAGQIATFYELGVDAINPISAQHGFGIASLHDIIKQHLKSADGLSQLSTNDKADISITIMGKPNVGKSTLLNKLCGFERALTGDEAGLTRDSIAIQYQHQDTNIEIIDTAGMRRKRNVVEDLEKYSVAATTRSMIFSPIVWLVVDAREPFSKQDFTLAHQIVKEGRVLVILANKWDQVEDKKQHLAYLYDKLRYSLAQLKHVTIHPICALKQLNFDNLLDHSIKLYDSWNLRISTAKLNNWLKMCLEEHPPPLVSRKRQFKIRYATQIKSRPPTLVIFCNFPHEAPESYKRYLLNSFREHFNLPEIPIRLYWRGGKNPYSKSS
jgi:GTP-binding protein